MDSDNAKMFTTMTKAPLNFLGKVKGRIGNSTLRNVLAPFLILLCSSGCSREAAPNTPPQTRTQSASPVSSMSNGRAESDLCRSIVEYAESLASGKLDAFFAWHPTYRHELLQVQQSLPQSEWGKAIPPVQERWRKQLQATVGQIPDEPMFENWAYQPDCGASFSVTEVRSDTGVKDGHIAFVKCEYANPTNAPILSGRRLSQVTLRCSIVSDGKSLAVTRYEPVSSLVMYHQIPILAPHQAEKTLREYLQQARKPTILIPTGTLDRGRRGTIRASSELSDEIVLPIGRQFADKSATFGVTVTDLALGKSAGGWGGSDGCYSLQFPTNWSRYGGPSEYALYDSLAVSVSDISRTSESECHVMFTYEWSLNEIAVWCKTVLAPFYDDLRWNYPKDESGQILIRNVGADRYEDHGTRLNLADLSKKTDEVVFNWSTEDNDWKCVQPRQR